MPASHVTAGSTSVSLPIPLFSTGHTVVGGWFRCPADVSSGVLLNFVNWGVYFGCDNVYCYDSVQRYILTPHTAGTNAGGSIVAPESTWVFLAIDRSSTGTTFYFLRDGHQEIFQRDVVETNTDNETSVVFGGADGFTGDLQHWWCYQGSTPPTRDQLRAMAQTTTPNTAFSGLRSLWTLDSGSGTDSIGGYSATTTATTSSYAAPATTIATASESYATCVSRYQTYPWGDSYCATTPIAVGSSGTHNITTVCGWVKLDQTADCNAYLFAFQSPAAVGDVLIFVCQHNLGNSSLQLNIMTPLNGDKSVYAPSTGTEAVALGWLFCAWVVDQDGTNTTVSTYLGLGEGSTLTLLGTEALSTNETFPNTWLPTVGIGANNYSLRHLRLFTGSTAPTLSALQTVMNSGNADSSAWADWGLPSGRGLDRSGNARHLIARADMFQGLASPSVATTQTVSITGAGGSVRGGAAHVSPVTVTGEGGSVRGGSATMSSRVRGVVLEAAGAVGYSAASGTTIAVPYPAGVALGEELVLLVGQKPSTANSGTCTTPTNWALSGSLTGAGGYSTTLAADTGNCNAFAYTITATSTEVSASAASQSLTVTVGTNSVAYGVMVRASKRDSASSWLVAVASGSDTTAGNASITAGTNPGVMTGDLLITHFVIPTDVTTPAQFSAETITATDVTFGTVTELVEPDSSNGNDIGGVICYARALSGTASAAPVFAATAGGTTTNVRGPCLFVRLRETQYQAVTGEGGAVRGGSATTSFVPAVTTQTVSLTGSGGAVMGGSAASSRTVVSTGAGCAVRGGAATSLRVAAVAPAGGSVSGGSATISKLALYTGQGGSVRGGSASSALARVLLATGGAVRGGLAAAAAVAVLTGSGGSVQGGAATVTTTGLQIVSVTGAGGAVRGGSSSVSRVSVATGSGGIVRGGAATTTRTAASVGAGGSVRGSSAVMARVALVAPAGGSVRGGSAAVSRIASVSASGGSVRGGTAAMSSVQTGSVSITGSGGSVRGGLAAFAFSLKIAGAGGSVRGGSAASSKTSVVSASGGVVRGGTAATARAFATVAQGGSVRSGSAGFARLANSYATGGSVRGGSSAVVVRLAEVTAITGSGGSVRGGFAEVVVVLMAPQLIVESSRRVSNWTATLTDRRLVTGVTIADREVT